LDWRSSFDLPSSTTVNLKDINFSEAMLLQSIADSASQSHPLSGTVAEWVRLLPVLPLAGFVINGLLSLNSARLGPDDPNTPDHHPPSQALKNRAGLSQPSKLAMVATTISR